VRERIGSYRIETVLAEGGMGLVYKGCHETLGRHAAIKTLLPKNAGDAALRARLLREARAQAGLEHKHIVAVYDLIEDQDELFIALEYVDGETLAQRLEHQRDGRLTLCDALPLFEQVLDALAYVHEQKIVHRDVKPSNVMVAAGHLKLTDFGLALLTDLSRKTASAQWGTPAYMSPEQLEGKSVDYRSDLYSAALVFYRMLTGRLPFEAEEYYAQIRERYARPVDLRMVVPDIPPGVCDAVAIALRPDRDERFPSIAAFHKALREGEAGFFVDAPPPIVEEALPRAEEMPTERMPLSAPPAPAANTRRPIAVIILILASTFAAALLILRKTPVVPAAIAPPAQKTSSAAVLPAPQVIIEPAVLQREISPARKPAEQPAKNDPFPTATTATEDPEAKRRAELESLRAEIRRDITRAEGDLATQRFGETLDELDHAAALTQHQPAEFTDERAQIAQLRTRVIDTRITVETMKKETAQWASRLARIDEDLAAERWPEAKRFAEELVAEPHAPADVIERARTLLARAKEGWKKTFDATKVGPTNNEVRKSSSPPRKDV
jgi:eukaryotic-like serine/threonine-protein kinase